MVTPSSLLQSAPKPTPFNTLSSGLLPQQIVEALPASDLAGSLWSHPSLWQTRSRINTLIDYYLSVDDLRDRLDDLPHQLTQPRVRPWPKIEWKAIRPHHIVGLSPDTFLQILLGIINTELPIRGYSQTSRQYLSAIHPGLAYFVGGRVNDQGELVEKGLWEREEQRHGPALIKVYRQLSSTHPALNPHQPRAYNPTSTADNDLYRHGMHRVATEYSATCLYIWLMAHTTGPLQQVFLELVKDEVNHMIKFWGFGIWLFPQEQQGVMIRQVMTSQFLTLVSSFCLSFQPSCAPQAKLNDRSNGNQSSDRDSENMVIDMGFIPRMLHTLQRMRQELAWANWSWLHRLELFYTFLRVILRLRTWHQTLTPPYLEQLLGQHSIVSQSRP